MGRPGTNSFTVPTALVIRGLTARVRPEHDGVALHFSGELRIEDGARLQSDGVVSFGGGLILRSGGMVEGAADITWQGTLLVDGGTLMAERVTGPALVLTNAAVLTSTNSTASQMHMLEIDVAVITVSTNSRIDVSGKGYLAGRTSGNTTNGASTQFSGGSYGGMGGGYSGGLANRVYGDYADPQRLGKWRKCGGYRGRTGEIGRRDFAVGWTGCGRWKFRLLL